MFEKVNSILPQAQGPVARGDARPGHAREFEVADGGIAEGRGGNALRAIEWGDLKSRLGAARDLRVLLRRDAQLNIEATAASFGDAAARYFAALEDGERAVNPDALEGRKASHGILGSTQEGAATGDARDD
jgi:hypothetical protein